MIGVGEIEHRDPSSILPVVAFNIAANDDRVPEVEHYIKTIKEP